jgi:uncharacterized protein (TIGR03083 family)
MTAIDPTSTQGPDIRRHHQRACAQFGALVHAVRPEQWQLPTPCAGWTVRDLVNHVVGENLWTVPLLDGATIAEVGDIYDGDVLGDDPVAAWDAADDGARQAVDAPGISPMRSAQTPISSPSLSRRATPGSTPWRRRTARRGRSAHARS